jgi:hypothetical protein
LPRRWPDIIEASGLLGRYAKDDRQAFSAHMRQQELESARRQYRDEIRAGIIWAEQALLGVSGDRLASRLRPA